MRLLFYINQFSNDILNAFLIFLNRILLESVDTEIVVICESELYKSALEKLNTNKNLINVINVYELLQNKMLVSVSDNSRSRKYTKLIFPKHYSNIEKQRVFDDKAVYDLYIVVQNILDEYDIKAVCYCNCMLAVFRSVGLLILHAIVQNLNLPFYWIATSPIKGRFTVYDSLYYDHKKIDDDYKILLKNSAMYSTVRMETFFKSYLDFKTKVHMPIFEQISKKRQISKIILDCLNKMMLICNHAIRIQNKNLNCVRFSVVFYMRIEKYGKTDPTRIQKSEIKIRSRKSKSKATYQHQKSSVKSNVGKEAPKRHPRGAQGDPSPPAERAAVP